jgi:hypothetical protein
MFTLKLYRNGPLPPAGKTVILETVGLWIGHCDGGVKHIRAFKKKVGVQDEDGTPEFYVGGQPKSDDDLPKGGDNLRDGIYAGDDDYYSWGVLENAMGKTTEMFR